MRTLLTVLVLLATLALSAATCLPLVESNIWWVRMTDFPRLQYAIALILMIFMVLVFRSISRLVRVAVMSLALAALAFNTTKIWPYFFGMHQTVGSCDEDRLFSIMVANVQLDNRHAAELLQIVEDRDPDILLALETNQWWDGQLAALSHTMPYTLSEITGSYFGMHLFSSLPLEETETLFPVGQDTPAILATVRLRSKDAVRFIGLHPRPPNAGQSSTGRDAELMWAALRARDSDSDSDSDSDLNAVIAGDFNAVPWERTTERLQRIGQMLDPRDIEGFLPTYDAQSWWMSWPLDQIMHQNGLSVMAMEVLEGFGSDHFPIEVSLCARAADRDPPAMHEDDLAEAETTIAAALAGPAERH